VTRVAGESAFARPRRHSFARPDRAGERPFAELGVAADEACQFEIFRKDEERMTSMLFCGGDWRWRLVTASRLILAEASGYPSETACRAAVAVLQKRAATSPVIAVRGEAR
jgi:uncharacterized protein YegP (UPF0339 family)